MIAFYAVAAGGSGIHQRQGRKNLQPFCRRDRAGQFHAADFVFPDRIVEGDRHRSEQIRLVTVPAAVVEKRRADGGLLGPGLRQTDFVMIHRLGFDS